MSITVHSGARLLFRVDPVPRESPRGYLCRVAQEHGYGGPLALAEIAGLPRSGLELDENAKRMAYLLRLEPEEWGVMCYRHFREGPRFQRRSFYSERISNDDLNYDRPRVCPSCLGDRAVWWAVWDLGLVTVCPIHRCLLLNQCPACSKRLGWQRPAVHKCRCGLDLRSLTSEAATADQVVIHAAIYRATGLAIGEAAERDVADASLPPGMLQLRLGSLLRLIRFVGSIHEQGMLSRKQRPFLATDLVATKEIGRAAVTVLKDWPHRLHEVLRRVLPPESGRPATLNFGNIFGNFYRHLFCILPRSEFGFLHEEFEQFVIEDWKGLIRGQHRYFSTSVRRNSHWVSASEAERLARTTSIRIMELVRQGQIEGIFQKVSTRIECWVRRESLNQWIEGHDAKLARYMPRPEAERALGLRNFTITSVASAGVVRYVRGPEQSLPVGSFFFLREDVMKIKHAFEKHAVPAQEYAKPGAVIALRHAMKNYLGRDSGLADVIRAVLDGTLVPTGRTSRFRGITGYLFPSADLRKYRPVSDVKMPPGGFLNFKEAATVLGVKRCVMHGLEAQGILATAAGHRNGFAKLIRATDVQGFADRYVTATALAKQLNVKTKSLIQHLNDSNSPLLSVRIHEKGRVNTLFVLKEAATGLQLK